MKSLSVVTTLYNSAAHVEQFYTRMSKTAEKVSDKFNLIFVNDGSHDASAELVRNLIRQDKRVELVNLSRNFGHHRAVMAGISFAKGDFVFVIDCDLKEPPELLLEFQRAMNETGVDLVYGVQKERRGKFIDRLMGKMFYTLFNLLSTEHIEHNIIMARLMTTRYKEALLRFREYNIFLAGVSELVSFKQKSIAVTKFSSSKTTYDLYRKLNLFTDAVTSFSSKPLVYVFNLSIFLSIVSLLCLGTVIYKKLIYNVPMG